MQGIGAMSVDPAQQLAMAVRKRAGLDSEVFILRIQAKRGRMATVEERLSRLEGGYEHLATKADLANLKADLIKWWGGMVIGGMVAAASIAVAISTLLEG